MRKYLILHVLIISFIFFITPTIRAASYWEEEIDSYKQAIRINPDDADAHYNLGNAFIEIGLYKEAIDAFKQAIRIKPDYAVAQNRLGVAFIGAGMDKEAIEAFKKAIKIAPDSPYTYIDLGTYYQELDMHKEAIDTYKQAIKINPDDAIAQHRLGEIYDNLGMHEEQIEAYKQAIRIDPDDARAHLRLGNVLLGADLYKEAIESFTQAIRIDPDNADAHVSLGVVFMLHPFQSAPASVNADNVYVSKDSRMYHHNRNCTSLRTTDDLMEFASPQHAKNAGGIPCNHCSSSVVRIEQPGLGKYKEAIEEFKQAIKIDPNLAKAHYCLGLAYLSLNDKGSALEQYKILKRLDSGLAKELFNDIHK